MRCLVNKIDCDRAASCCILLDITSAFSKFEPSPQNNVLASILLFVSSVNKIPISSVTFIPKTKWWNGYTEDGQRGLVGVAEKDITNLKVYEKQWIFHPSVVRAGNVLHGTLCFHIVKRSHLFIVLGGGEAKTIILTQST